MEIKNNKMLKKLIPPLSKDQSKLFELGLLGFRSKDQTLLLTPSTIGAYWFHAQFFDLESATEHYTKRPMALSRLLFLMPYYDAIKHKELIPCEMTPEPLDYNDRVFSKQINRITNVYIIQSIVGGPVKIGKALNVSERLKQHQCGSPYILQVLKIYENVDESFEAELHNKFTDYRLHGEWFDEKILTLI